MISRYAGRVASAALRSQRAQLDAAEDRVRVRVDEAGQQRAAVQVDDLRAAGLAAAPTSRPDRGDAAPA